LDAAPRFISPTLTYPLGHDYSFKTEQQVSILTLDGRVIVPYMGYARHVTLIQQSAPIGATKPWYDKPRTQFYLLVSLKLEVAAPTLEAHQRVVGVDVGQRYLAVVTWPSSLTCRTIWPSFLALRYVRMRTTMHGCGSACSAKALARPPGDASPSASERDGSR
jgi:hypothetical protein